MTDQLTGLGSVEAGNPSGGNGTEQNGSGSNAAATIDAGPDTGNLDWAKAKGWLGEDGKLLPEKLAEGYQSLEKRIGTMVALPDDKSKPEDVEAFHKRLGWPGEAKGYEFKVPENMPKDVPYDQETATWFREAANELRLPATTAQALHDKFVARAAEIGAKTIEASATAFEQELTTKASAAHAEIVKEWGAPGSEDYLKNRDAAVRAADHYPGLRQELAESGLLLKDGSFTSPTVARLLADLGRVMQNDTFIGNGRGGSGGGNPFEKGPNESATAQSALIKRDPSKAAQLAKAAGWSDQDIGWKR